jgi:3-oxoacyl-[acyl-carrier-protein] synthase-3
MSLTASVLSVPARTTPSGVVQTALRGAALTGTGSCLGEGRLTNAELEMMVDTSDAWIRERTGIVSRPIAGASQATSDLALGAARAALADAGLHASELDLIIVATVTPDMPFPSTACIVQEGLGARRAVAFDLAAACAGFLFGVTTARSLIGSGLYQNALIVGAETLSRITDYRDRGTCVLFGDGAGAVVLTAAPAGVGVVSAVLSTDGSGVPFLYQPAGGSRLPASVETVNARQHFLHMVGPEVFKCAVRGMVGTSLAALEAAGVTAADLALVIPHQANLRIIEAVTQRLGVPSDRVAVNIEERGNMSSASIPVALDEAARAGRVRDGDLILMTAFGAGWAYGSVVLRWGGL